MRRAILIFMVCCARAAGAQVETKPLEQITLTQGDVFVGYVAGENQDRLTVRVKRLIILQKNGSLARAVDGVHMLTHKDGSIFTGRFLILKRGDFFLNESLFPENFDIDKKKIALRQKLMISGIEPDKDGFVLNYNGLNLFFADDGFYKEGIKPEEYPPRDPHLAETGVRTYLQLFSGFAANLGRLSQVLPGSWYGGISYGQETRRLMPFLFRWLPWLHADFGFLYATRGGATISGGYLTLGPQWIMPLGTNHILFGQLSGGGTLLAVRNAIYNESHFSPIFAAAAGIGHRFSDLIATLFVRYAYIHDPETALAGVGIHFALMKTFGDWN